jgi:hypothetical protein
VGWLRWCRTCVLIYLQGIPMESILEIREGCVTPAQLLKSLPFTRFLERYKREYLEDLVHRDERYRNEWEHRSAFVKSIRARDFLALLHAGKIAEGDALDRARELASFFDGGFHHFRTRSYSRLVRLQNEVITQEDVTSAVVKGRVTEKARDLSELLLETRRALLDGVGLEEGTRRTPGLNAFPNVTAGEVSGHYFNLPPDYMALSHVPLTIAADIQTGVDYTTPSNKRAKPFYELGHNPFRSETFNAEEWVAVPLTVGAWLIVAYIHKSRGCIEMEPGLLNLFPFANVDEISAGRKPDGIFLFGDPNAADEDLGYWWDAENEVLVGLVPNRDELKYFGYCKKPVLTLHNVLAIRAGDIPLHCGCTRYKMRFDEAGAPYIAEMRVKSDDMGRIRLERGDDAQQRPIFYGTETGAFACLDGFSERAKMQMQGREVGYNRTTGSNARQIVPVSADTEVRAGHQLDVLLYANNFRLKSPSEMTVDVDMSVMDAVAHFRLGERVAAGSTQTFRGARESSYWANPFPLLQDPQGQILHPELHAIFQDSEDRFIKVFDKLSAKGEMLLGVAHSQLMAGAAADNSDADIAAAGFTDRESVEMQGPEHLARDLIVLIKRVALEKRARLGDDAKSLSVTVAIVGDSRTGKSETAEKMEGVLDLTLV